MLADLHTHTTASDGKLSPPDLLRSAEDAGVDILAITDHDTVLAYESLLTESTALKLIPGIEFSALWRKTGVHVVGLNIDPAAETIREAVAAQRLARMDRAEQIATRLEKRGFENTLAGAVELAGDAVLGRPHFAEYLVASGQIADISTAFKKHLGQGKAGDVRAHWPDLQTVNDWIRAAGGIPVLAHPAKYKLTNLRLEELVWDFKSAGGAAVEVISGLQTANLTGKLARMTNRHGLLASCGSDFHQPGQHWARLGQVAPLPENCAPVWSDWL